MRREIKFQVFRNDTKEIVGHERINDTGHWEHIRPLRAVWLLGAITDGQEYSQFIRRQFTGLLDKNGKEIWEGDIVKISVGSGFHKMTAIGLVAYEIQACAFWIKWNDGVSRYHEMKADSGGDYFASDNYDVIGNIHQNPELLK